MAMPVSTTWSTPLASSAGRSRAEECAGIAPVAIDGAAHDTDHIGYLLHVETGEIMELDYLGGALVVFLQRRERFVELQGQMRVDMHRVHGRIQQIQACLVAAVFGLDTSPSGVREDVA